MNVKIVVSFAAGVVTGAAAAYFALKKRFDKKLGEEVGKERSYFNKRLREMQIDAGGTSATETVASIDISGPAEAAPPVKSVIDRPIYHAQTEEFDEIMTSYRDILERAHYGNETFDANAFIRQARESAPKLITYEDFGQELFECVSLTYLLDNVLVDELSGNMIPDEEIGELVGQEAIDELVEGEDAVYVRNAALRLDIEILHDRTRSYSDFLDFEEDA